MAATSRRPNSNCWMRQTWWIRYGAPAEALDGKSHSAQALNSSSLPLPQYYKPLNIRVALIGLEVWTDQDMINVSDNPHSTLAAFLSWRSKQLHKLPNDNAQLITSVALLLDQMPRPLISHPVLLQISPLIPPLYLEMITSHIQPPPSLWLLSSWS